MEKSQLVCEGAYWFLRSLLLWLNKQRKDRWLLDDETSKTSANPKKKKQLPRPDEGKQSKSNVTISEEKPESASALPCREGEHWKKKRDGGEVHYRCGSFSLGLELQIDCLLVIRFENNKRNRFIPWGLQLPPQCRQWEWNENLWDYDFNASSGSLYHPPGTGIHLKYKMKSDPQNWAI